MSDAELNIDWGPNYTRPSDEPMVAIYTDLDGRLNAAADRQWFGEFDQTDVGVDADKGLLVFDPGGDRQPITISREKEHGGDISIAARAKQIVDELDETIQVPLEERGEFIIADVGAVLDDAGDVERPDVASDQPDSDDAPGEDAGSEPDPREDSEPESESEEAVDEVSTDDGEPEQTEERDSAHATTQPKVEEYLFQAVRDGDRRFKAKKIAAELDGVGSRAVASCMTQLREADVPVVVTKEESDDPSEGAWWVVTPEAEVETEDGPAVLDLSAYTNDLTKLRVQNAITGATNVLDVQKNLSLPREEVAEILQTLGLYADLNAGRPAVKQHEVRSALRGVEVRD
ncbi:MAG: hypothetical protein ACOCY1_00350 [Halovenus sp.]